MELNDKQNITHYLSDQLREFDKKTECIISKGYPINLCCYNGKTHYSGYIEIEWKYLEPLLDTEKLPQKIVYDIWAGMKSKDPSITMIDAITIEKLLEILESL